ncbi:MAG: roadblock/LC7 domain-containing protein [Methanobacteriaceae archaeon]
MSDIGVEKQLEEILIDLERVDGIDGSLIADNSGKIIIHRMHRYTDVELFGSMSNVIVNSSERLLNSAEQGKIERVLMESSNGKALFLDLDKVNFIILMELSANIGLVMVSAKRAAEKILEISKDLKISMEAEYKEEIPSPTEMEDQLSIEKTESERIESPHTVHEEFIEQGIHETVSSPSIKASKKEIVEDEEISEIDLEVIPEEKTTEQSTEDSIISNKTTPIPKEKESAIERTEEKEVLPSIKPPISFPELPENITVPSDAEERSQLILDIYEAIFLAMSLGASKIMGVAPARGLTKKFLPLESCKKLLVGVDVKTNSVIDFNTIRENASKISIESREKTLINDFSKIIDIITENYGKVMGYDAFRGMVRPEFNIIKKSYGNAMEELDIKKKIHPELINLLN